MVSDAGSGGGTNTGSSAAAGAASAEVESKTRELIARIGRIEAGFSSEADIFRDLGVKSAAALDLLLSLEEEFGISISDDAFGGARTLRAIVQVVEELRSQG